VSVEGAEVVNEESYGATVICALELDKFCVGATVVAAVPSPTRTRIRRSTESGHPLPLLLA
jgi:hypothetical protein